MERVYQHHSDDIYDRQYFIVKMSTQSHSVCISLLI